MKNKILIYTVLVLGVFVGVCNAQENTHEISIIDESTMEPVPFARVSFGHSNGVYSDSNGQFAFTKGLTDSIAISHLSFKGTIVLPSKIVDDIIFLTPGSYSLNEVVVTEFTGCFPRLKKILADGGCKGQKLIDAVRKKLGADFTVVLRPDESSKRFAVLPLRWIVERSFSWLESFRRVAMD